LRKGPIDEGETRPYQAGANDLGHAIQHIAKKLDKLIRFGPVDRKTKIILVQVAVVAGLIVYFKVALPSLQKGRAEARAAENEQAIQNFLATVTIQMPGEAAANGARKPRRLRREPDVSEVQESLGAPNQSMTDFAGAQHLTWFGTEHKLTASFNKGRLYALTVSDLAGEHGERVYESSARWQKF